MHIPHYPAYNETVFRNEELLDSSKHREKYIGKIKQWACDMCLNVIYLTLALKLTNKFSVN